MLCLWRHACVGLLSVVCWAGIGQAFVSAYERSEVAFVQWRRLLLLRRRHTIYWSVYGDVFGGLGLCCHRTPPS